MRLLISIGILGLFGMVVVWFVILNQYLRTLKNNYYQLWVELGKPAVFTNNTPQTNVAVFRHLRTRAYQRLSDHDLSKQGDRLPLFFIFYLIVFVLVVGLMTILFITNSRQSSF
jgi:hypothetical protein